ncbi:unnamed protein product [Durusdinium trenchii]|uniref:Methyltransferase type 11 domain-containing protein n=1 Tax=Durusdinium trenchii TaxID=1381693 RepID=A0ABP0PAE8_9DINO
MRPLLSAWTRATWRGGGVRARGAVAGGARHVHQIAREGFATSEAYERGRPSYPPCALQLLDHLLPSGPLELLDLGAGTEKWTMELLKYLHTSTAEVVIHAVEPSDGFRQRLQQNLSTRGRAAAERPPNLRVEVCEGDAQSLQSFGAKRMDGVFVATAFHWFATPEVLESIYQVLKDAGWLYLIWNVPLYYDLPQDRAHYDLKEHEALFLTALKKEVVNIYHDQSTMEVKDYNYKAKKSDILKLVNDFGKFGHANRYQTFYNSLQQVGDVDMVIQRILSTSSFNRRSDLEKDQVKEMIKESIFRI